MGIFLRLAPQIEPRYKSVGVSFDVVVNVVVVAIIVVDSGNFLFSLHFFSHKFRPQNGLF
jgi:hypothetical protein